MSYIMTIFKSEDKNNIINCKNNYTYASMYL